MNLFPAFTCTNNIGGLVNGLFGVITSNPFVSFTFSSSSSSGGIGGTSIDSYLSVNSSSSDYTP